jgi:hypothetical protein
MTAFLPVEQRKREAAAANPFSKYQTDPIAYAEEVLGLTPWPGTLKKGQRELFEDVAESVRKQLAGEPADKIFRVEAGNGIGKTFGGAMLVNWFFDAFAPSITITTAPTINSVTELLWKDIKKMRPSRLPGRVLPSEPRMLKDADHFAIGKTTSDADGRGEERFKGQHEDFCCFVLDEAEGLKKFVFDAVIRMMTGNKVVIVLMFANPRSRNSEFFRWGRRPGVQSYCLSALDHPNVVLGKQVVPGATTREWVDERILEWCDLVTAHCEDDYTFEVPWRPGEIWKPTTEFMTSIMGVAPANSADDVFVPSGRYDAAKARQPKEDRPQMARIGVDAAGYGNDTGTIYARWNGRAWRAATCSKPNGDQDTTDYWQKCRKLAFDLYDRGVRDLNFRLDAGGGFANGLYDRLKRDGDLLAKFPELKIFLVHFGGAAHANHAYADVASELYAHAGETLKGLALLKPPENLELDLTDRHYELINLAGVEVKKLEPKRAFKRRLGRSPDDGDGLVLATGPDFLFVEQTNEVVRNAGGARKSFTFV